MTFTPTYRPDTTPEVRANLDWMAEHPGEWLWWAQSRHPVSAHGVKAPSFERRYVSWQCVHDGYGPHRDWKPGLWVRFVGGGEANVTDTLRDVA